LQAIALLPQQSLPSSGRQQHLPFLAQQALASFVEGIEGPVVSFPSLQFIAGLVSLLPSRQQVVLVTSLPWQQACA